MYPEIKQFNQWLRCQYPQSTTAGHHTSDVRLFFEWASKPPGLITIGDVDAYIAYSRQQGHAITTINRRLAALRTFYRSLNVHAAVPLTNPVIPRRHRLKQGRRLPRDVPDNDLDQLFAVITSPRDQGCAVPKNTRTQMRGI
jgi:site-specific recombinase XerD